MLNSSHVDSAQLSIRAISTLVSSISVPSIETWGDTEWLVAHVNLERLALQSTLNVRMGSEETVSDAILEFDKVQTLIQILTRTRAWNSHVYPIVKSHLDKRAVFIGYSLIHHENLVLNLLQTVLFKQPSVDAAGDAVIDLIDVVCGWLSWLNGDIELPSVTTDQEQTRVKEEYDSAWHALACVCHLTHHLDALPVSAIAQLVDTHDIVYLIAHVLVYRKWESKNAVYIDGVWDRRHGEKAMLVTKPEGLAWMAMSNLLNAPDLRYQINSHRRSALLNLLPLFDQNPTLMTQLPFLESTMRKLLHMQMSPGDAGMTGSHLRLVHAIPVYVETEGDWPMMAREQKKTWTEPANREHAARLSKVYDLGVLELLLETSPRCGTCGGDAEQKCSRCLSQWYCSRQCQVSGWKAHRDVCKMVSQALTSSKGGETGAV